MDFQASKQQPGVNIDSKLPVPLAPGTLLQLPALPWVCTSDFMITESLDCKDRKYQHMENMFSDTIGIYALPKDFSLSSKTTKELN